MKSSPIYNPDQERQQASGLKEAEVTGQVSQMLMRWGGEGGSPRGPWEGEACWNHQAMVTKEQAAKGLGTAGEGSHFLHMQWEWCLWCLRQLDNRTDHFLTRNSLMTEKWK